MLAFLGAAIAGELDETGTEISAEARRLAARAEAERNAMRFTNPSFLSAVDAFAQNWGDLACHLRDAQALFREIRIVFGVSRNAKEEA